MPRSPVKETAHRRPRRVQARRTKREARAALRIIKAFVRNRQSPDPTCPLPGSDATSSGRAEGRWLALTFRSSESKTNYNFPRSGMVKLAEGRPFTRLPPS